MLETNQRRDYCRDYYIKNKDKINSYHTKRYHDFDLYKGYYWKYDLRTNYGITPLEFISILTDQDYRCKLCGNEFKDEFDMNIGHDHDTSIIRGILCRPCNMHLGMFNDSPELLRQATDYLENSFVM